MNCEFIIQVMEMADRYDIQDEIYWHVNEDKTVEFYLIANDIFFWGAADAEDITPDNLPLLEQAIKDCEELKRGFYGPLLFIARNRQTRPQGSYYSSIPDNLWPLFDACGPERETGLGNPYRPGEYGKK